MEKEKKGFIDSLRIPALFVGLIWVIKIVEELFRLDFVQFGVYPRYIFGLKGILFYPFIHGDARMANPSLFGDFAHVANNSLPMLVLGFLLFQSYRKVAWQTLTIIYFLSGILVWLFAHAGYHIGASGLIYGLAFFIFFSGVFRKDIRSIALALFVAFWYGGIVWGVLPLQEGVSWEGHLFGAVAGVFCAYLYRNVNKEPKHVWEEEDEDAEIIEKPFWVKEPPEPTEDTIGEVDLEALKQKYNYIYKKNDAK